MPSNIHKIAINTIIQYVELILNVLIGLFSVRLILSALGASDYGIYDLIGGVIALLGFITTTLSQTSMRFLSVSLGDEKNSNTKQIFSSCFWMHIAIGGIIALLLAVVGLFLFDGALNIPSDRLFAAQSVYYFMIASLFMNISTTPFLALLYSHEQFVFVSCLKIVDSVLKLLIAIAISIYADEKLVLYGMLMAGVTAFDSACYITFSLVKYRVEISIYIASFKPIKSIASFAGWTILDVMGGLATRQGYAVLLNCFFGTIMNATFALARQIEGHLYTISASVINSFKPQIMKSHGAGDNDRMFRLSMSAGKMGFSMMSIIAIPLLVLMPEVLSLWLKEVPNGTVLFSRLMVVACMCEQLTRGLVYANQATGNIKWFSISISAIRMLALPLSWISFKFGAPAHVAIVIFLGCETIGSASRVYIFSRITDFNAYNFVKMLFKHILPPFTISLAACIAVHQLATDVTGVVITTLVAVFLYLTLVYSIGLTKQEKMAIESIFGHYSSL
ncbi:MAG: hypothetical protein KBT09_02040 [Bacteroidales bacterium]|nr:hypothetical protein [Candidatus Sodaliphilus fimicaballi]